MATAFPIGVSSQPINIAGAGVNFMRSAVDAKLREIEQNREEIGENAKNALKAMSISTIEGLSGAIRDRYQEEIENYRNTVIDKFRNSGGKLSLQQQKEIQDGFVDLTKRMQGDVTSLKKMEEVQKLYLANPYAYQESLPQELRSMQLDLEKGKAIEDPMLLPLKNAVPISTSDYVLKKYAAPIKNLDVESLANFKGNVFNETETRGLGVEAAASRDKAIRLRDEIMRDSWVKYRAGEIDSETYNREKKTVEDAINQVISQSKPFRQTTGRSGSGSKTEIFVDRNPDVETVIKDDVSPVKSMYASNIPATFSTPFMFNGEKVSLEGVKLYPVAKNKKAYKDFAAKRYAKDKIPAPANEHGIIDEKFAYSYDGDIEYVAFAKIVKPKDKNMDYFSSEQLFGLPPDKTEVVFTPYDGNLRGAIVGKLSTKGQAYDDAVQSELGRIRESSPARNTAAKQGKMGSKQTKKETTYTPQQETVIKQIMDKYGVSRQEAIDAINKRLSK